MHESNPLVRGFFVGLVIISSVTFASPLEGQQVAATVQLPGANLNTSPPSSLALDASDEILFVGAGNGDMPGAVYGIYIPNASIIGTINIPGDPTSMAYSPSTGRLYSTNLPSTGVNNSVAVINTKANPITMSTIYVGSSFSSNPSIVALNPVNGKVYTTNYKDQSVSVINPSNNSVTTIPIQTPYPDAIAFDSVSGEVYVASYGNFPCNGPCVGSLTAIDPTTNIIAATVQVGNSPYSLVADPSTHNVYVANQSDSTVDVISPSRNYAITNIVSTGANTQPSGFALDATGRVYVALHGKSQVDVITPAQGYSVTPILVGNTPSAITFDSGANLIAVASQAGNTVSYISPSSLSVTATVAVGPSPNAMITNGTFQGTAVANGSGTVSLITD